MPTEPPVDAYLVCATPRSGSSLLLGLLDSTGVAGHPQAYFREPDEPLWARRWQIPRTPDGDVHYADYLRAASTAGRTGNGVFGAKLMWGTLDELVAKLATVHPELAGQDLALLLKAFGRTEFIYLRRDDAVAQAVSWLRAEQTGTWFVGGSGEISGTRGEGREPTFDADRIGELIQTIDEHNAAWENWFASAGVRPYRLRYEDLADDHAGVAHNVLRVLGLRLPDGRSIVAQHHRQADDLNLRWATRYRRNRGQGLHPGTPPG